MSVLTNAELGLAISRAANNPALAQALLREMHDELVALRDERRAQFATAAIGTITHIRFLTDGGYDSNKDSCAAFRLADAMVAEMARGAQAKP